MLKTSHVKVNHVLYKDAPVVDNRALSQIFNYKLIALHVGENLESTTFNKNYLICFAPIVIEQAILTRREMNLSQIVQDVM